MKKIWIVLVIALIVVFLVVQSSVPQAPDWSPDFRSSSTKPYGGKILYDLLPELIPGARVFKSDVTAFEDSRNAGMMEGKTYFSVGYSFAPDDYSTYELLNFVEEGNTAFIAAAQIDGLISKRLGFRVGMRHPYQVAFKAGDYFETGAGIPAAETEAASTEATISAASASDATANDSAIVDAQVPDSAINKKSGESTDSSEIVQQERDSPMSAADWILSYSTDINLLNEDLRLDSGVWYQRFEGYRCFTEMVGTSTCTVLGRNQFGEANFMHFRWGEGDFYISTVPFAYSNFNMLQDGCAEYAARSLSYLPNRDLYWDNYTGKNIGELDSMRLLRQSPALMAAIWTGAATLLLFLVFSVKRRQRIIPVITPPSNATLGFVGMVGNLYYQRADHVVAAHKKIRFLLEYIRRRYFLRTNVIDHEFRDALEAKSGVPRSDIDALFDAIDAVQKQPDITAEELADICRLIDAFYSDCKV